MNSGLRRLGLGAAVAAAAALALVPAALAARQASTLTYCSDITYPPEEFYQGSKAVGSDIDIGTEVAKRVGMQAKFANTGFDGIIAALLAKRCDAIISGMNVTPERAKQVAFVTYIKVGQSLMVKKGNPDKISSPASLSGKSVSVEVGTTNADFLNAQSKLLKAKGKPGIQVVTFPKDTDAAAALKTGRVNAYFGDSPVVAYYIKLDPSLGFAGAPINPIPVGIALRKGDAMIPAVQKAVTAMYKDGTMQKILAKWQMSATALK